MKRLVVFAMLLLLASRPALAEPAKSSERLLVYTLQSPDRWRSLAKELSEDIVLHLSEPAKQRGVTVLSESEVALMASYIKERADLAEVECRKTEICLSKLSRSADAEKILSGRIDRLGDSYFGVLYLHDALKAERLATESCVAGTEEELRARLMDSASRILGFSGGSSTATAPAPLESHGQKVAVIPITGLEDRPGTAETLTDLLGLFLQRNQFSVLTRKELLLLLHDVRERRTIQNAQEPLDDILIQLARAYDADYLVTGHVAKLDQSIAIVLKLIQISKAKVIRRIGELYRGPDDYLPDAMTFAAMRLFGHEPTGAGDLSIATDVKGEYRLNRGGAEALPQAAPHVALPAAKYELSISAPGYWPYTADLYVMPGSNSLLYRPSLEPLPDEWYETPLFWGIVGVAVAGATTAVLLATVPPKGLDAGFRDEEH